jgi:hypothetical protein
MELELGAFSGPSGPEGMGSLFPSYLSLCLNSYNISIINPTKHHSFIRLQLEALQELYSIPHKASPTRSAFSSFWPTVLLRP